MVTLRRKRTFVSVKALYDSDSPVILILSLFTVLMMPTSTTKEKKAKIRDMEALGRWYAIAVTPNERLAGTLKPS